MHSMYEPVVRGKRIEVWKADSRGGAGVGVTFVELPLWRDLHLMYAPHKEILVRIWKPGRRATSMIETGDQEASR